MKPIRSSAFGPIKYGLNKKPLPTAPTIKPSIKLKETVIEPVLFILITLGFGFIFATPMGLANMFNTIMNTAYGLLINTCFYIMAIAIITGAFSALLSEFGVLGLIDKLVSPIMKPLYGLPGAASLGILTTYLSDNPAILTLADNPEYRLYFKKYQLPALTNLGTSFGMGLIITTFMIGLSSVTGENFVIAALIGNVGAILGSIVSTRIMLNFTSKRFGKQAICESNVTNEPINKATETIKSLGERIMNALLDGGKSGVKLGFGIIPGVLIICTFIMMLTNGASADGSYTGAAYEGIGLLPLLADKIDFILQPLFGFTSPSDIAVPLTALGAAGAAIGLIPQLLNNGLANAHDIAVFTAMCMCWSGYLATHVAMMDSLNHKELTGNAIFSHTIGGIVAGISANWLFLFFG